MKENLVDKIAKIIRPGIFDVWYKHTGDGAEPVEPDVRKKYYQADARLKAATIMKLLLKLKAKEIRQELIDDEIDGWRRMIGDVIDKPELQEIIKDKYA